MLFKFLKYIRPVWYFNKKPVKFGLIRQSYGGANLGAQPVGRNGGGGGNLGAQPIGGERGGGGALNPPSYIYIYLFIYVPITASPSAQNCGARSLEYVTQKSK